MKQDEAAARDLENAFSLDPTDPLIAHNVLISDLSQLHVTAAKALIVSPRASSQSVRVALATLFSTGLTIVANMRVDDDVLIGWVAWTVDTDVTVVIDTGTAQRQTMIVQSDLNHHLSSSTWKTAAVKTISPGLMKPSIRFLAGSDLIGSAFVNVRQNPAVVFPKAASSDRKIRPSASLCNVIVPIYDDLEMTALCLEALARQPRSIDTVRVIMVNDRPDDAAMQALTRTASMTDGFELIENDTNLGFIGSINKALATVATGDILLLNADAILSPGAIERLRQAANSQIDIGTVTPLTNNGELTNLPRPLQSNPMGSLHEIAVLSAIAAQVNKGQTVTLPCGIGFCLYIRADCFEAVGALSTAYLRGYMEDVEFCLRAREAGFRNVCAADVYVGHMGTRSFKGEKQGLVVRNLKVLEARFPEISDDTLAFLQFDPLKDARTAIELRAAGASLRRRLIVAESRQDAVVQNRIDRLKAKGFSTLTLTGLSAQDPGIMTLCLEDDGFPQSTYFDVTQLKDNSTLVALLRRLAVVNIEVFSTCILPNALTALLAVADFTIRTLVDSCPFSTPLRTMPDLCETKHIGEACVECCATFVPTRSTQPKNPYGFAAIVSRKGPRPRTLNPMAEALFQRLNIPAISDRPRDAEKARKLLAPVTMDQTLADQEALQTSVAESASPNRAFPHPGRSKRHLSEAPALGILSPAPTAASERLIRLMAGAPPRIRAGQPIVVFGRCLDDISMLSFPNMSVTGFVDRKDYGDLFCIYEIGHVFVPERWGGFQPIDELARDKALPYAYFDWSFGAMTRSPVHLGLDPRICDTKAVRMVLDWFLPVGEGSLGERS